MEEFWNPFLSEAVSKENPSKDRYIMLWLPVIFLIIGSDRGIIVNSSQVGTHETEMLIPNHGPPSLVTNEKLPNIEMITQKEMFEYEKRSKTERMRRRKEKNGKISKIKSKASKNEEHIIKHFNRNNEKDILVRNRTIEILKNGVKILSTSRGHSPGSNKSSSSVNETLLEKILSSGASKPDLLISSSGIYKLPIGGSIYKNNVVPEPSHIKAVGFNQSEMVSSKKEEDGDYDHTTIRTTTDYEYDYENFKDTSNRNQISKSFEKSYPFGTDYGSINADHNVKNILQQIIATLRNYTVFKKDMDDGCGAGGRSMMDPCAKWLECKTHLETAFLGQHILPSCPCHYPSTIFYNDAIWDQNQKRFFRWRDASNEGERLDIYKPGAVYCIRSLLAQNGASISTQQCCYDGKLRLLTRGSGAGTINFVSPDVSRTLHDTIDILPWRLCKGDFTRYNLGRNPDNGNRCPVNPNQEQYDHQVKSSKYF